MTRPGDLNLDMRSIIHGIRECKVMTEIDTGTQDLLATLDEGVAILTLNRPQARNAMSGEMNAALQAMLADFEVNPKVKVVVLTGAGKGFCAGGDVKGMARSGDGTVGDNTIDGAIHQQRLHQRGTAGKLFKMPKPTLAALPGAAAGAGLSLALACDAHHVQQCHYDNSLRKSRVFRGLWRHLLYDPVGGVSEGA
jgi:enoyl-CoA hydratase/carnithine racemase